MKPKHLLLAVFFGVIVICPILTFALPQQDKSDLENRKLQTMPSVTADTFIDSIFDKSFMNETEKFLADQFPFREAAVKSKSLLTLATLKQEINGVFVGKDMLLEKIDYADPEITATNVRAINEFAKNHKDTLSVYMGIIPSSVAIYPNKAPVAADTLDQATYIKDFYGKLEGVSTIDMFNPLITEADKYIYYHTDHHWTSYGAYVGYKTLGTSLGYRPASHDMFNVEHASYDFYGTLYSKVLLGDNLVDTIDLYSYTKGSPVTDVVKYRLSGSKQLEEYSNPTIFYRENLETRDKYRVFLDANEAVVKIKTNVKNQKKLILFGDSFSRSLMQFLPNHYEEIAFVNLQYLKLPLDSYIDIARYDTAIFLQSINSVVNNQSNYKVAAF